MNEIQVFNYNDAEVRTIQKNGEPWFVLKDVASILCIDNHKDLPKRLETDEVGRFNLPHPQSPERTLEMTCINESGLYSVILRSDKPEAKPFRKWVTSEVLPSIRKHGIYATQNTVDQMLADPDTAIRLLTTLKEERAARQALEVKVERDKPKVLFADAVSVSKTSILIGELAKLLKQNGVKIGQNRLFAWMRENGYLIRRMGSDYNLPTQRSMDMGLFEIKESCVAHADGHTSISKTPKITGKGQIYFVEKFLGTEKAR